MRLRAANEFFTWTPEEETVPRRRSTDAGRRTKTRRAQTVPPRRIVFFGGQGRRGHDDPVGELRSGAGAPQQAIDGIVDLKAGLGEGRALLGMRSVQACSTRSTTPPPRSRVPAGPRLVAEAQAGARDHGGVRSVRSAGRRRRRAIRGAFPVLARQYETSSSTEGPIQFSTVAAL